MIVDLMVYSAKIALLIGIAALALECAAAWRGLPRRGLWAAALVLSVALPAATALMPRQTAPSPAVVPDPAPSPLAQYHVTSPVFRAPFTAEPGGIRLPHRQHATTRPSRSSLETALQVLWVVASTGLAIFYAFIWMRLRMAARHWRRERLNGHAVWVTEALGPAVVGFMRPAILIPHWVLHAPSQIRALVLAHEQEHIAARDPALLLLGLVLVAIAPWNPLLWWQMRRLRFAIEVDCDTRVLCRGEDPAEYGKVLLAVGRQRSALPAGVMAATEPASQLLRRVRILTADLPKRGKWALSAAVGLSLASLALAAEFDAPAIRSTAVGPSGSASAGATTADLRKLPLGENPSEARLKSLVRATYPELFDGSEKRGTVLVTILMNPDGTLYKSFKEETEPTPWITTSLRAFDAMGVDDQDGVGMGVRMEGSPTVKNRIDVHAWYRELPADPSRDVAAVRAKVRARYASLFRPMYADGARVFREGSSLVTVFMTETGDIERAQTAVSTKLEVDKDVGAELLGLATPERFAAMGIAPERIGAIGSTELYSGHYTDDRDFKTLAVIYAWPRRAKETAPMRASMGLPPAVAANDDPAVNRAMAEHYFADLYTHPKEWPRADPWILLDRQGKVMTTGRRVVMSGRDAQLYIESLYPGIRTDGVQVTTVWGGEGRSSDVGFVWLAADSPVTDLAKADLSKRGVLLYADVVGEGMTRPTELMALKSGSSAVQVCALKNPFGVVHVEVTTDEIAGDGATLRIRLQHAQLGIAGELPEAIESAWSEQSAPVLAPFGGSADVQVTDQNGRAWKIVLHPERLSAAAS